MKSKQRHQLKTNELAEMLGELPEVLRKNASQILGVVCLVIAVFVGFFWWRNSQAEADNARFREMQKLLYQVNLMQLTAAQESQTGTSEAGMLMSGDYDAKPLAGYFGVLSRQATDAGFKVNALLQQAQTLRSQLLFSKQAYSPEEKKQIYQEAEQIYQQILQDYPREILPCGVAQLALGILAEDQNQWDKAREIYEIIAHDPTNKYAGTALPEEAQKRLLILEVIQRPLEFQSPPPRETTDPTADSPRGELPIVEAVGEPCGIDSNQATTPNGL